MNIQVEHLENHTARLKVEITQETLDKAMQTAARRIGQKVNIPGFRRGKAPYGVILRHVGQGAVLEEALDTLGNEVYVSALKESKIEPYAPGTLEDFKTTPNVTLTFTVAKQPSADLGDYRAIRLPFEPSVVEDKMVDDGIEDIRGGRAVIEPVTRPAQIGDMLHGSVWGEMVHPAHEHSHGEDEHSHGEEDKGEKPEDAPEGESAESEVPKAEPHSETIVDREDFDFVLYGKEQTDRDLVPGFAEELVGLSAGENKTFTIAFPDDHENKALAGHSFNFKVTVDEVKSRTLPDLNDDFADQASEGKFKTLLELRVDVRRELQEAAERQAKSQYADKVLAKIMEGAVVSFPEEMVQDYTSRLLQTLDRNLRQQGLTLERLIQVQGKTEEALRADYRENAVMQIKRDVVISEVVLRERLSVNDEAIRARVDEMTSRFSDDPSQAASFRRMFERPEAKQSILNEMLTDVIQDRLNAIARGEELPELEPIAVPAAEITPEVEVVSEVTPEPQVESVESTDSAASETPEMSGDA